MPFLLVFRSDTAASLTRQGEVAFREQFIAVNDRPGGLQGEGCKPLSLLQNLGAYGMLSLLK